MDYRQCTFGFMTVQKLWSSILDRIRVRPFQSTTLASLEQKRHSQSATKVTVNLFPISNLSQNQTAQVGQTGTQGLNFAEPPIVAETISTPGRNTSTCKNPLLNVAGFEKVKGKSQEELRA